MSDVASPEDLGKKIADLVLECGFRHFGMAALQRPRTLMFYKMWLERKFHGDMTYLERHLNFKENPKKLAPRAESAIVITQPYLPHPEPSAHPRLAVAPIALYARGRDYHQWLQQRLERLCCLLRESFPGAEFLPMTDAQPVLERELAQRAGLGWIGKNTCLISRQEGSLTFIGEIYTSLQLPPSQNPATDHCGKCRRCLDACPTGALSAPYWLDSRKCISYWTIESRAIPASELRKATGTYFFGCDLCQTVCPWNQKVYGAELTPSAGQEPISSTLSQEMAWILEASNSQLKKEFVASPLWRAGAFGLRRNAMLVVAHYQLRDVSPLLRKYQDHPRLAELATWVLAELGG